MSTYCKWCGAITERRTVPRNKGKISDNDVEGIKASIERMNLRLKEYQLKKELESNVKHQPSE